MSQRSGSHQKAQVGPDAGKVREDAQEAETRAREGGHPPAANQRQERAHPPNHGEARSETRVRTATLGLAS